MIERIGAPLHAEQIVREAVYRGDFGRLEFSRRHLYTGPVDAFSERARHYEDLDTGDGK